jgi:hypothetical protein
MLCVIRRLILVCRLFYNCRSLLDDPTFHDAAQKATNEQIPYYQQVTRPKQAAEGDEQALPLTNDRATLSSPDVQSENSSEALVLPVPQLPLRDRQKYTRCP